MKNHPFNLLLQELAKLICIVASVTVLVVALGAFAGAL